MKANKSIEERIHHLEHLLAVVLKNQEQIKKHLWSEPETKASKPITQLEFQEQEAINYVDSVIKVKYEQKVEGELMAEGFFDGVVLNYLKQQTLIFIGQTLKKLN